MANLKAQVNASESQFTCTLSVPNKFLPLIQKSLDSDDPVGQKAATIAEGALLDLCDGGMMLNGVAVKKLTESLGRMPTVDEVVQQFSRGVGRVDGKMELTVSFPPETESMFQQIAEFQGVPVKQVLQDLWNTALDNGDFYDYRPYVSRVLMRNDDKAALVKVLGKDFATGTDLAEMVKKYVAENASPFEEVK